MPREPDRLLGELVRRRGDVLQQGEVLATLGLAWVLRHPGAARAFCRTVGIGEGLLWKAEVPIPNSGRPDLIGQRLSTDQAFPICVVEAKIHHLLSADQLRPFANWQMSQLRNEAERSEAVLVILVPESRRREAEITSSSAIAAPPRVVVVIWEDLLVSIANSDLSAVAQADLEQLRDLYHQIDDSWVAPFLPEDGAQNWLARRDDYVRLADQITLALQEAVVSATGLVLSRAWPMQRDGYRYVQMEPGSPAMSLAIGLFPRELSGVPFAVRYHRLTPRFSEAVEKLKHAGVPCELPASGNLYVRLAVPPGKSQAEMLADLRDQVLAVARVVDSAAADSIARQMTADPAGPVNRFL